MAQIPDAPWIRDAELNGYPEAKYVRCPVCGRECDAIYQERNSGDVVGCDWCVRLLDAYDWQNEQEEDGRDGEDW